MSYKYDVCILLKEENYLELWNKVRKDGFEQTEIDNFFRSNIYHHNRNFASLVWNYVKWDAATDEVVEMIEQYIDMLDKNNIPFRYITIGELDEICDRYNYGKDKDDIAYIASVHPITKIYNGLKILN